MKTCKFLSVLTIFKTIKIADSNSSAKDESMLEVGGAVLSIGVTSIGVTDVGLMFSSG